MTSEDNNQDQQEFLLNQYLDGDLDEVARGEVERQLADDPGLAALAEQLGRTDRLVQDWAGPVPELDWDRFAEEVARRREQAERLRRRRRLFRLFAPLSAAAAILLLISVFYAVDRPFAPDEQYRGFAEVSVRRGDAWKGTTGLDAAYAEVSVVRSPGLQIIDTAHGWPGRRSASTAATTAAGLKSVYDQTTPYF